MFPLIVSNSILNLYDGFSVIENNQQPEVRPPSGSLRALGRGNPPAVLDSRSERRFPRPFRTGYCSPRRRQRCDRTTQREAESRS